MQAGKLDNRIRFERATNTQDPRTGEQTKVWVLVATVWADAAQLTGRELFAAQQVSAKVDAKFRIRWPRSFMPTADETWRIGWDGRYYDITSVAEIPRRVALEILGWTRAEVGVS